MSWQLNFSLANPGDDAELRALLRSQFLPGWVSLSFEREPNYFAATAIEGIRHRVLVARDSQSNVLVGFCTRATRRVFINGEVRSLGYLGQLRAALDWQGSYRTYRAMSQGFTEVLNRLRDSEDLPFDITSILADNHPARRLLEADLPGMPHYQRYSGFNTLVYRSGGRKSGSHHRAESGAVAGMSAISEFLQRSYRGYQFSPVWDENALHHAGLAATDFLVVRHGEAIKGCLAIWDQRAFKQTVVHAYRPPLNLLRPLVNLAGPVLDFPRMPGIGETINQAWLSHLACDENAIDSLEALLSMAFTRAGELGLEQVMLGLSDDHPLLPVARRVRRHLDYRSDIYLVRWGDTDPNKMQIDKRPIHVELATL
jgi:hypothetical protein